MKLEDSLAPLSRPRADSPAAAEAPPRRRWLTRLLLPLLLLLVVLISLGYSVRDYLLGRAEVDVVAVVPRPIEAGAAAGGVVTQASGWLEADPFYVGVSALAEGVVEQILVLDGQEVSAGQVVAKLIDKDARLALARAAAEVELATGELAATSAALEGAQRDWDHPIERTRAAAVARAALASAKSELERWPSQVKAEQAQLTGLKDRLDRAERLHPQGAVSWAELVEARSQHESQAAVVESMKLLRPSIEARIAQHEAEVTAAEQRAELRIDEKRALDEARANAARAKAALDRAAAIRDEAALRLERMDVKSPIDGVVLSLRTSPGQVVSAGTENLRGMEILRVYDPKRLQVRVDVPIADAAKVHIGQRAQAVVSVLPSHTFEGEVTRLVHEADIQRNTIQVKVALKAPDSRLKPEMLARVRFLGDSEAPAAGGHALFIPQRLVDQSAGAHAWIVDQSRGVAARRKIELGSQRVEDWIAVREGLRPGDLLITNSAGLTEGQRVRIRQTKEGR